MPIASDMFQSKATQTPIIQLKDVGVCYRMPSEKIPTLKEYIIQLLRRKISHQNFWALQNVNIVVNPNEAFGIIGPNGAGKSTLLKVVSRVLRPTKGHVRVIGKIAPLLELGAGFDSELTGRENIYLNGVILGSTKREVKFRLDRIVEFSGLQDFIDAPLRTYSTGMIARLGFAIATDERPDILIIDEILSVGDAEFQTRSYERIEKFLSQGTSILLVTHDINRVETMCQHAVFLSHGQIVAKGNVAHVVDRYLGRIHQNEIQESTTRQIAPGFSRWGNRKIEIINVEFFDKKEKSSTIFKTGDYFAIRIDYEAHELIDSPVFGIAVYHNNGIHITGPNTQFAGLNFGDVEGNGWVVYEVEHLPLLDGLYHVSVAIVEKRDSDMYDFHDRAYTFRISNDLIKFKERYGTISFFGSWRHNC